MNMKTARDIPPSAVVCLSLGLFIGSVIMPKRDIREQPLMEPPMEALMEVTLVDEDAGRAFERPQSLGASTRKIWYADSHDSYHKATPKAELAIQELVDVAQQNEHAWQGAGSVSLDAVTMSDAAVSTMLAVCTAFGVIVSCVDFKQMLEEEESSDNLQVANHTKDQGDQAASNAKLFPKHRFAMICTIAVGAAVLGLLMCLACKANAGAFDSIFGHASTAELRLLVDNSQKREPALVSDTLLMIMLGAWGTLGLACLRADNHEMAEEMQKMPDAQTTASPPSPTTSAPVVPEGWLCYPLQQGFWNVLAIVTILIASVGIWMVVSESQDDHVDWHAGLSPDSIVMLGLGAFAAVGLVVMHVDIREMTEEFRNASEYEETSSSPTKVIQPAIEEQVVRPSLGKCFICLAAATTCVAWLGACAMLGAWLTSRSDSVETTKEIRDLVQLPTDSVGIQTAPVLDYLLLLGLGIFASIGVVVMRFDHNEIIEAMQNAAESEVPSTCPSTVVPPLAEEGVKARTPCPRFFKELIVAAMLVAAVSAGLMTLSINCSELVGSFEHSSNQELSDLVLHTSSSMAMRLSLVSDNLCAAVLGGIVVLGMAVMRVDLNEMTEESQDRSESEVRSSSSATIIAPATTTASSNYRLPQFMRYFTVPTLVAVTVALGAMAWPLIHSEAVGSVEHAGTDELRGLSSALVPDHILMLALAAFVGLGAVVMRVDFHDMAEQFQEMAELEPRATPTPPMKSTPSSRKSLTDVPVRHRCQWRLFLWRQLLSLTTAAVTTRSMMLGMGIDIKVSDLIEEATGIDLDAFFTELAGGLPSLIAPALPDSWLLLILVASTVVGLGCMWTDTREMSEEFHSKAKDQDVLAKAQDVSRPADACLKKVE